MYNVTKIIFKYVSKKDARLLVMWWNANTTWHHFIEKHSGCKFYKVVRYVKNENKVV
jgi:hypothetical protein